MSKDPKDPKQKVNSPAQPEDWEERFEQLFIFHERPSEIAANKYEVLDFIRNLLNEAREEERERIRTALLDFKINEEEPWATLKRLRDFLSKKPDL